MRTRWIALALLPIAAVACAKSGPNFIGDEPATTPAQLPVTTIPVDTSTVVPTAVALTPTTIDPPTTPTPTTIPETTAPPTTVSLTDEVTTAWTELRTVLNACVAQPQSCELDSLASPGSPAHDDFSTWVAEKVELGQYGVKQPSSRYVVESVTQGSDGSSATLRVCFVDADWLVGAGPTTSPDDDAVVDSSVNSLRVDYVLAKASSRWRVFERTLVEQLGAGDLCGAS